MFRFLFQLFCAVCFITVGVMARDNGQFVLAWVAWFLGVVFSVLVVFAVIND